MFATSDVPCLQSSVTLASAGYVVGHEGDAAEKWLEEEYIGPGVEERSWQDFGQELCSNQGGVVLFKALFTSMLHPQGWVRSHR